MDRGTICAMATGTVLRHPDKPPHLFVNEVGVRDGLRGRGIGRALMAAMLGAARARGCAEAWVATEADNSIARALYRGAGGAESEPLVMYEWTFDDV
jgi:ribosomal protein S18 acetylase RimI-like enzyme